MSGRKRYHKYLIGYYPFDNDFNDRKAPYVDLIQSSSLEHISIESGRIGNSAYCVAGTIGELRNAPSPREKYVFDDGVGTVPYTISMQVKMISAGNAGGTIVGLNTMNSSQASSNAVWWVGVESDLSSINFRKYSLATTANYTDYRVENPPVDEWFQLTISDDARGNVRIWFENTLQTAIVTGGGTGFVRFAIGTNSRFGLFNALGVPTVARFLEAYVDDLAIFKGYAFTQEDVDYVNNNGNPRKIL